MKTLGVFLLVLFVASCTPSAASIQTAIAKTQAAVPTATAVPSSTAVPTALPSVTAVPTLNKTPHPFLASDVKLDPSMIDATELGVTNGVPISKLPEIWPFKDVHAPQSQLSRQLLDQKGDFGGWISILVYQQSSDAAVALHDIRINAMADAQGTDVTVGDAGVYYQDGSSSGLVAARCHLGLNIIIKKDPGSNVLESFVGSMLKALEPEVCEPGS